MQYLKLKWYEVCLVLILYLFYQLVGKCHFWTWLSTFMDLIINIHGSVKTWLGIMYFCWASSNNHQEGPRTAISAKMIQASWNKSFTTACFDLWFCMSLPERRRGLTSGICRGADLAPGVFWWLGTGGESSWNKTWYDMIWLKIKLNMHI